MAKRKLPKKLQVVACIWKDAAYMYDGDPDEPLHPEPAATFGLLVEEGEDYVKIASEIFGNGCSRQLTSIPKGMVQQIIGSQISLPDDFNGWSSKEDSQVAKKKKKGKKK